MKIVTRFAPSPTGFLHIGGARTALFNYLFAKRHGGEFLLRIEDTDRQRSTAEAIDAIFDGLNWLGIKPDQEPVFQSKREDRHKEVVQELLAQGKAYYCYCSKEELDALRQKASDEKRSFIYPHIWRDKEAKDAPKDIKPVVRIKAPLSGKTIIEDAVQGKVEVANETLDDFIILRSDGTPTYMFAVVVDDHDMGVTHIIRGDDHLTNAFRQKVIYDALNWDVPVFAHIPLIHGNDGAKMSKRHGAIGVDTYRDMGYLPEAMRNYLLRLGWSHGDDEIISDDQAREWFDLEHIGKSPARFDFDKLNSVNGHYLKHKDDAILALMLQDQMGVSLSEPHKTWLAQGIGALKERSATLEELKVNAGFYLAAPVEFTDKAKQSLDEAGKAVLKGVVLRLQNMQDWHVEALEALLRVHADENGLKLGQLMAPIRAAITGSHASPSMFEVMAILGKEEVLKRLTII